MPLSTAICTPPHDVARRRAFRRGLARLPARVCRPPSEPLRQLLPPDGPDRAWSPATGRIVPGFVATSQGLVRCDAAVCNRRVDDTPRGLSVCEPAAYRGGVGV